MKLKIFNIGAQTYETHHLINCDEAVYHRFFKNKIGYD